MTATFGWRPALAQSAPSDPCAVAEDPGHYPPAEYRKHVLGDTGLPSSQPPREQQRLPRPPGFYSAEEYRRHVLGDTGLPEATRKPVPDETGNCPGARR